MLKGRLAVLKNVLTSYRFETATVTMTETAVSTLISSVTVPTTIYQTVTMTEVSVSRLTERPIDGH